MSIRVRLLLLILGTLFVPAFLSVGAIIRIEARRSRLRSAACATMARGIATSVDAKVQGTTQLHFGLSRARDLDSRDKAACSKFLSDVLEKNPDFTGILTIKPDGSLFCDSLSTGRVLDLRDRGYFQSALKNPDTAVIEPVFGRLTGAAVLQIAYPAHDEARQLRFVLLASLDLNRLMKEQIENLPPGFEFLLVDGKGTVFVRSPAQHRTDEQPGTLSRVLPSPACAGKRRRHQELACHGGDAEIWATAIRAPSGVSLCMCCWAVRNPSLSRPQSGVLPKTWALSRSVDRAVCRRGPVRGIRHPFADRTYREDGRRLGAGDLTARVSRRLSRRRTRQPDDGPQRYRLVARTPAARHRGAERQVCGGRRSRRRWRSNGTMSPSTTRRGPAPLRRIGAGRHLQPALHENVWPVAPVCETRLYLSGCDRASKGDRLARHRRRGIYCGVLRNVAAETIRRPIVEVGRTFNPGS